MSTGGTQYVLADHQGSPRVTMRGAAVNGQVVLARQDYLPFGEEISGTVGPRAGVAGYDQSAAPRQKYAGMERDEATQLSHTLWREFDSSSARWTAPDPYGGSMSLTDPQSFNRYAYVNNDPVNQVDPQGLKSKACGGNNGTPCTQADDYETVNAGTLDQKTFNAALTRYIAGRAAQGYLDDSGGYTISMFSASMPAPEGNATAAPSAACTQNFCRGPAQPDGMASANLTIIEVTGIVYNETQSLSGDANALDAMYRDLAHVIINGDNQLGKKRPIAAPSTVKEGQMETDTYKAAKASVMKAVRDANNGIDPTGGAIYFNLRANDSQGPFQGNPIQTHHGPFKNSYPSKDLPKDKDVYVNTYKPPRRRSPWD